LIPNRLPCGEKSKQSYNHSDKDRIGDYLQGLSTILPPKLCLYHGVCLADIHSEIEDSTKTERRAEMEGGLQETRCPYRCRQKQKKTPRRSHAEYDEKTF
jgi:hypothetical protein